MLILGRIRKLASLDYVLDRDQPFEPALITDDGEFLDLVSAEDLFGLLERGSSRPPAPLVPSPRASPAHRAYANGSGASGPPPV